MNCATRCSRDASLPRTFPVCPCPERNRIRAAVFEGFVDFLLALVLRTVTDEDCLVLNSYQYLEQ